MRVIALTLAAVALAATAVFAMGEGHDHSKTMEKAEGMDHGTMDHGTMDHSAMDGIHTTATINSIDGAKWNVTHPAIPALKWPPMTMDMMLVDGAETGDVKAGDAVMLMLEKGDDGMVGIKAAMPAE